jgi:hypothetical protein
MTVYTQARQTKRPAPATKIACHAITSGLAGALDTTVTTFAKAPSETLKLNLSVHGLEAGFELVILPLGTIR